MRAKDRAEREQEAYEKKVRDRNDRNGKSKGRFIKEPKDTPEDTEQANLTDADSRIMRKSKRSEYIQGYNAQAVVDVDAIPEAVGTPATVLADKGYASEAAQSPRRHDFRPVMKAPPSKTEKPYEIEWVKDMRSTMATDEAKNLYRLRKQSVEPVFGIIKQALGFRQFLLRGLGKVELEWKLVTCACNLKRQCALC